MKIAYVFKSNMASTFQLGTMILPQLEDNSHMVNVIGMFFFDDNIMCLQKGNPVGERLAKIAKEKKMLLMVCDQCAVRRELAEGTFEQCGSGEVKAKGLVDGVVAGCFPQLYSALGPRAVYNCGKHPATTPSTRPFALTSPLPHCSKVPSANSLLTAH